MASIGVNVLRWSALFSGAGYGFYHQRSLHQQQQVNEARRKYNQEESLIAKAKAEYVKKTSPDQGSSVILDVNDPKFDLEAFLHHQEKQEA